MVLSPKCAGLQFLAFGALAGILIPDELTAFALMFSANDSLTAQA